jgi:preprotein translocase subunit SecG
MNFLLYTTVILMLIICIFLILLVLIQKGRGGGLASAFGGGGGNTAFGSKTGDVLTWATSVVFGIFLILGIVTNLTANALHHQRTQGVVQSPTPGQTAPENPMESAPVAPATQSTP